MSTSKGGGDIGIGGDVLWQYILTIDDRSEGQRLLFCPLEEIENAIRGWEPLGLRFYV